VDTPVLPATARATLHDGSVITVTARGSGPAVLLPVRTDPHDGPTAESMRRWGADPDLGVVLADGLADRFRVITADYEGHRMAHPAAGTLTAEHLAADLIALATAAGADRFAYYGYSWLGLAGLQVALRTDRLWGLVMGGYPPVDGPYAAMLAVTRAAHVQAAPRQAEATPAPVEAGAGVEAGDWDAVQVSTDADQTGQFVTLYESLRGFDDATAQRTVTVPRLAFAGAQDEIVYGPGWGDVTVPIAPPLVRHHDALVAQGWDVRLLPGLDHMGAMHSDVVLPLLRERLTGWVREGRG
jgi:pimeloyl-ACP methyl ester carboxylesterase